MARSSTRIPRRAIPKPARRRRTPELAREEILAAAERVFSEFQPDTVGLKHVARAAGVSHALVTHYFGTYAALVDAVLEQRLRVLREELLARMQEPGALERPGELLARLFRTLDDPVHLRLARWSLASERAAGQNVFLLRDQGLRLVARQVVASLAPDASAGAVATVELALLAAVAAIYGYALGKPALTSSLGRPGTPELDDAVVTMVGEMLQTYLHQALGLTQASGPGPRASGGP